MKRFLSIWFNRVSGVFYLGTFILSLMLFCNPYLNIFIFFIGICIIMFGGAYATEELVHTEGEKIYLKYFEKIFG